MSEHAPNQPPDPVKVHPVTYSAASNSRFITADDLTKPVTVKIREVEVTELEAEDGSMQNKIVIWFEGKTKGWVSNTTNNICLAAMFGENPQLAVGKRVTLHAELAENRKMGIRVVGSPDIAKDLTINVKLPKRRATKRTLKKTVVGSVADPVPPAMTAAELEAAERAYQAELEQKRAANEVPF